MWLKREEEESLKRNVLVRILIFLKNGGVYCYLGILLPDGVARSTS
ncbi:unnamed protein product [marine sediment metagenome]|uniref:Uncharacterized protein n=1 Tax=marine sediment metagenome TaxID=412755 RepID=X1HKV8_9ZZZZ